MPDSKIYFMRMNFFTSMTVMIMILLFAASCKQERPEETLRISTDAALLTTTPGPDFGFNLKVESAMPSGGVRIDRTVKGENDNQNYPQGPAINTANNISQIYVSNLPRQKFCICTVTVTSNNRSANTATTSFRIVYK